MERKRRRSAFDVLIIITTCMRVVHERESEKKRARERERESEIKRETGEEVRAARLDDDDHLFEEGSHLSRIDYCITQLQG